MHIDICVHVHVFVFDWASVLYMFVLCACLPVRLSVCLFVCCRLLPQRPPLTLVMAVAASFMIFMCACTGNPIGIKKIHVIYHLVYTLYIIYYILHILCYILQHTICSILHIVYYILYIICHIWYIIHDISHIYIYDILYIIYCAYMYIYLQMCTQRLLCVLFSCQPLRFVFVRNLCSALVHHVAATPLTLVSTRVGKHLWPSE